MAITGAAAAQAIEHLDPLEFDAMILAHGTPVLWRRSYLCPCVDVETRAADVNCPQCFEFPGRIWDAGESITVLMPGRSRDDHVDQVGEAFDGAVMITFPSTVTPGHLDRVELTNAEMVVNNERLFRGAVDKLGRSLERVRIRPVTAVEGAWARLGGTGTQPTFYKPVDDFAVDPDTGAVTWFASLAEETQYAIRYRARTTYVLWAPMSRDEGGIKMPYRVRGQRLDFFRAEAIDG